MKTEKRVKDIFVNAKHEAESQLYGIFGKDSPITILDIGACDGLTTIQYARMFPQAKLYAFEMRRDNYDECEENFELYGVRERCTVICRALGNYNGTAEMYSSYGQAPKVKDWDTGNKSSSILRPTGHLQAHPWCQFRQERVGICRLDEFKTVPCIDCIHIDVQGAEIKVFEGAGVRLKEPRAIWAEMVPKALYAGQPTKPQLVTYLRDRGFDLVLERDNDGLFVRR